jgi:hypothetical protein
MDAEPILSREEALPLIFIAADILEEVRAIRDLLEGDDEEEDETE